jgi:hypothetical protein
MKKIILLLALALNTAAAHAEWTKIDYSSNEVTLYIDRSTAEKSGPRMVLIWHIADYATPQDIQGKPFKSIKFRQDYNCDKGLFRDMLRSWHREGMGNSITVSWTHGPWGWTAPEPGSADEALVRAACSGR